jgi:hypothetical protein
MLALRSGTFNFMLPKDARYTLYQGGRISLNPGATTELNDEPFSGSKGNDLKSEQACRGH